MEPGGGFLPIEDGGRSLSGESRQGDVPSGTRWGVGPLDSETGLREGRSLHTMNGVNGVPEKRGKGEGSLKGRTGARSS